MNLRTLALGLAGWSIVALAGCASTAARGALARSSAQTAPRRVRGEEFRIVGRPDGGGEAYDATLLFDRANAAVREHRFEPAIADYERVVREFPGSRLLPAAYFNRGVCLQVLGRADESLASYREAIARAQD